MVLDKQVLILAVLGLLVFGGLFYAIFYNTIQNRRKTAQRMKSLQVDPQMKARDRSKKMDEKQRRKMREESLKVVDQQKDQDKAATNPVLAVRLTQAGMTITPKSFRLVSIGVGAFAFFVAFVMQLPIYVWLGAAVVFGYGLPNWFVNFRRNRRFKKFITEFPNAVDVIVRGIRSGLPLNDCIRIIANDAEEPVRGEFQKRIEATQVGLTMPEACQRLYHNVPTSETNFFAIVISIQASAGGNLSEALSNLSSVLRERKRMADKIKAVSAEAKASAMIIGSLPFVVGGLISFTSPGYMNPLFSTNTGNTILAICGGLMIFGIGVMKKMINFKF